MAPLILGWLGCDHAPLCGEGGPCEVESGTYYAVPPEPTDEPVPMLIHFHGYGGDPAEYLDDPEMLDPFAAAGWLVVFPVGVEGRWSPQNSLHADRDEMGFTLDVLSDVRERWSIDDARLYVSGFSLGASVAYDVGCFHGDEFAGMVATSGGFWEPLPSGCTSGPIPALRIHGTSDDTWPYQGGTVEHALDVGYQSPVDDDVAWWHDHDTCGDARVETPGTPLSCTRWDACDERGVVELCTHEGGHERHDGWADDVIAWLEGTD